MTSLPKFLMTPVLKDRRLTIKSQENEWGCLEGKVSFGTGEETEKKGLCFLVGLWVVLFF